MQVIYTAFIKAKRSFGPALKDKTNPAFRSKYADLGACIDAVEDALLTNGIAFIQETTEDATGVTVETVFLHESGESMRCGKLHVPAAKQDPQGYGSALTYARRYSLMAACGIAPEDDDGNAASKPAERPARAQPKTGVMADVLSEMRPLTPEERDYFGNLSWKIEDALKQAGVGEAYDLVVAEKLDNDGRLYLESFMASNVRSALKKEGERRRALKAADAQA